MILILLITPTTSTSSTFESITNDNCPNSSPINISASDGTYIDKIMITWNTVSYATGYNIYRSDNSEGSYTKIATSTSNSYNDVKALSATDYYYKSKCN